MNIFKVVRQPTPLGRVTSVSRFQGRFEKVEGTIYRELEAYNISPKIFNEFDEEEPDEVHVKIDNCKCCTDFGSQYLGLQSKGIPNGYPIQWWTGTAGPDDWGVWVIFVKALLSINDYKYFNRLADYKKMAENLATPSDVWKKMAPTSLNLAKGSSWFYFSSQPTKQIVFMRVTPATEEKGSVIKEQLRYYIEDEKMRPLSGWVFVILNLNMYLCEWLNFQHFVEERDG